MTSFTQHPPQASATSTPAAPTVAALKDLLWEPFIQALGIKRRLFVLRAFADELDRVRRGKVFRFRNDIMWRAMLDHRDKLVIDLCSLTVAMRHGMKPLETGRAQDEYRGHFKRKRGLFIELRDHHVASLTRTYDPHPDDDADEIARYTKSKAETFARLFPNYAADTPSATDIELLCETFRLKTKPLKDDRNQNRAHPYEQTPDMGTMHWVPQLSALFEYTEQLLEDLSTLSGGAAYEADDMNDACSKETAADVVDMILLGNISDVMRLTATRTREELYARLHAIDDDAQDDEEEDLHFNDRQFDPSFEDWLAVVAATR